MVRSRIGRAASVAALSIAGALAGRADGCTTEPMPISWLADHASCVVIGEVAAIRSSWVGGNQRIESEIVLAGIEYLKGASPERADEMTIAFPGGTVGDVTMRLCCAPEIRVGDRFVMFLQPEYRTYPTAGLGQGILRVQRDAEGVDRVRTARGAPIIGIGERGVPIVAARPAPEAPEPVGIRGEGIRVRRAPRSAEPEATPRAMSLDDFLERVTPVLETSRAYDAAAPVARPIDADMTPVPLRRAPGTEGPRPDPVRHRSPRRIDPPDSREETTESGDER